MYSAHPARRDRRALSARARHAQLRVSGMLDLIEGHLLESGPWMLGTRYSAVDRFVCLPLDAQEL
jgi:hypothetical protein